MEPAWTEAVLQQYLADLILIFCQMWDQKGWVGGLVQTMKGQG